MRKKKGKLEHPRFKSELDKKVQTEEKKRK